MAKKDPSLSFTDIVLRAEADVIQQAYEARVKIDELLAERTKAYEQIATLEEQVDSVLGEPGVFPFPAPPLPIAGFGAKAAPASRPKAKKPASKATAPSSSEGAPDGENRLAVDSGPPGASAANQAGQES